MRVLLAPMEGVLDPLVRSLLTEINDYDLCITEFLRVVDRLLPTKSFYRLCPELYRQSVTPSGTPVRIQLLGQDPYWLAANAQRAVQLGSRGVDLNCGCPSKTVNGHGGGASLLKDPELIFQATRALRAAVPSPLPVSVKVRLGWDSTVRSLEIAQAVAEGGASELVVHGRTREDGYRAEAINWSQIGQIRACLDIPVIANGEIWDYSSANLCRKTTGCQDLMVGRGALHTPNLSRVIKYNAPPMPWAEVTGLLYRYCLLEKQGSKGQYHVARIKQWLGYLRKNYPQAFDLFQQIRTLSDHRSITDMIERQAVTAVNHATPT